jgi:hypothetical protein
MDTGVAVEHEHTVLAHLRARLAHGHEQQAGQAVLRRAGLGVALLAGGLLLPIWRSPPIAIAAVAVAATTRALAGGPGTATAA